MESQIFITFGMLQQQNHRFLPAKHDQNWAEIPSDLSWMPAEFPHCKDSSTSTFYRATAYYFTGGYGVPVHKAVSKRCQSLINHIAL